MMKIELEPGVWLADGKGDPPRALCEGHAKEFTNIAEALRALADARKYRPFPDAQIIEDLWS